MLSSPRSPLAEETWKLSEQIDAESCELKIYLKQCVEKEEEEKEEEGEEEEEEEEG